MLWIQNIGHPPSTEGRGVSPPPQMLSVFQQLARSLPAEAEDIAPVVEGCYGDAMGCYGLTHSAMSYLVKWAVFFFRNTSILIIMGMLEVLDFENMTDMVDTLDFVNIHGGLFFLTLSIIEC